MISENWMKNTGAQQVLLLEGADDCHVVVALCKAHNVAETFGFYNCEGQEKVLTRLFVLLEAGIPPQAIGIVLDADDNPLTRWQSLKDRLQPHGYTLPDTPSETGTIIDHSITRLGLWLMPDNREIGMLEDFCLQMVEPDKISQVRGLVTQAESSGLTSFKAAHRAKADVHTWLAWQDEPGRPLGQAITANVLRPDTATAKQFTDWLGALFQATDA